MPSTTAGSPASPTWIGSIGIAAPSRAGDPERAQPALVADPARLVARHDRRVGRVDALGEVPQPLPALAAGDRDLAAHREELEHLGDVAVVRPARGRPRHDAACRGCRATAAGRASPSRSSTSRRNASLRLEPGARRSCAGGHTAMSARCRRQVAHRPDHRVVLVRACGRARAPAQLAGIVGVAEPRPRDEVGARRDRRGRVELQEGQALDDPEQGGRPLGVEELGADRDAARLLEREPVGGGVGRVGRGGAGHRPEVSRDQWRGYADAESSR